MAAETFASVIDGMPCALLMILQSKDAFLICTVSIILSYVWFRLKAKYFIGSIKSMILKHISSQFRQIWGFHSWKYFTAKTNGTEKLNHNDAKRYDWCKMVTSLQRTAYDPLFYDYFWQSSGQRQAVGVKHKTINWSFFFSPIHCSYFLHKK